MVLASKADPYNLVQYRVSVGLEDAVQSHIAFSHVYMYMIMITVDKYESQAYHNSASAEQRGL